MPAAFPLDRQLSYGELLDRLSRHAKRLSAIQAMRLPQPGAAGYILAKDNIGTDEFPTTAGSFALRALKVPDADCIGRLKRARYDVFGKTNMSELAGFVTTNPLSQGYSELGGRGINPHGDFPCGGSSSGSAIAVAAGLCDAALGTETRGSLMEPGLKCGVRAFKPTRGLISCSRVVPLSHSFDTVGIIARSTALIARLFSCVMDSRDSAQEPPAFPGTASQPPRIALIRDESLADSGATAAARALRELARRGLIILTEVAVPPLVHDYRTISSLDIARDMTEFLGRYGNSGMPSTFSDLVRCYRDRPASHPYGMDRLEDALAMPRMADDVLQDLVRRNVSAARALIAETLEKSGTQFLASPTFLDWWAIAGAPSITVPLGHEADGRPSGFMLGGAAGTDWDLLSASLLIEELVQDRVPVF